MKIRGQSNKFLDKTAKRSDIHRLSEKEANRVLLASIIMIVFTLIKSYNIMMAIEILAGILAYIGTLKYEQSVKIQDFLCILSIIITGAVFTVQTLPCIFLNIGW